MAFSEADVEAAMARANGQQLSQIMSGALNTKEMKELGQNRVIDTELIQPKQKKGQPRPDKVLMPFIHGTGHAYSHVATFGLGAIDPKILDSAAAAEVIKSRWQDRRTAIAAATEMMNSRALQKHVAKFTGAGPIPSDSICVKQIPLAGVYYGYQAGDVAKTEVPRLIEKGAINFCIIAKFLFIYSCYPEDFVARARLDDHDFGISGLFN
jgi:hypothetical protein